MRKRRAVIMLCVLLVIAACLYMAGAFSERTAMPVSMQSRSGEISEVTTQRTRYDMDNSLKNVVREVRTYHLNTGEEYLYDGDGNLIAYSAGKSVRGTGEASLSRQDVTEEQLEAVLAPFISDGEQFSLYSVYDTGTYYEIILKKAEGTVCEDQLILRLSYSGEIRSFNLNRSGIEDPSEVDTAYYEQELLELLPSDGDVVLEQSFTYMKVDGVIWATATVTFQDASGGNYVKTYWLV